MTDDDKALVERLRSRVSNREMLLVDPPRPAPDRDCHYAADRIEALSAENERKDAEIERLREKLIGIRAEIDDMENPFNGGGAPEMAHGFEVAVDQAFNIVTAALEGGE